MVLRHWMPAAALVLAACGLTACDPKDNETAMPESAPTDRSDRWIPGPKSATSDQSFMDQAGQANLAEIATGQLADTKATSAEVRTFGQHMVVDHTAANTELADLARKKGVVLPDRPSDEQEKTAAALGRFSGAEFDKKYMGQMVVDHQKAVSLFETFAHSAKDQDVRDFAKKMLPKLQDHWKMAKEVNGQMGGEPTAD